MYGGSGVAVAVPDEKLCPRTLAEDYSSISFVACIILDYNSLIE